MSLVAWSGIERHFGAEEVLRGASGALERGDRVALVGPNGCGKTTLLKVLAGLDGPDGGTIALARGATVGYLPQRPEPPAGKSLRAWVMEAFAPLEAIERELDRIHEALAGASGEALARLLERQGTLQADLERRGAFDAGRRAEAILGGLGFRAEKLEAEASALSGGEKSRGALARILCEEPDLLLLDEPTNHLDIDMLEWLEAWLAEAGVPAGATAKPQRPKGQAVIVVSHDRYFLDRVAERVMALDRGRLVEYAGNYSRYVELREERRRRALKERAHFEGYVERQRAFIRRFRAGQRSREAAGREKRLEREIEEWGEGPLVEEAGSAEPDPFDFGPAERSGHDVLRVRGLGHAFPGAPSPLFERFDLDVARGDRIGVVGPNGSGKTTFLRLIAGDIAPDRGDLKLGASLRLGYYRQEGEDLDPAKTALEEAHDVAPRLDLVRIRGALGRFGLGEDDQLKTIGTLSGGERARVTLARLFLGRANLLLLDEPTNHLDLEAREALESALDRYGGTLVAVSHDRYFLDRVTGKTLDFGARPAPRLYGGTYSDYRVRRAAEEKEAAAASRTAAAAKGGPPARAAAPAAERRTPKRPPRVKRRHTFEELEEKIIATEARLKKVEAALSAPGNARDYEKLRDLSVEYDAARRELAALNGEWETWADNLSG